MIEQLLQDHGLGWHQADSARAQAVMVAERIAGQLQQAIEERGEASLALSGGRGPELFLRQLEQSGLDWSKVTIMLVDERWVPAEDEQSNAGLLLRCMPGALQQARWIPMYRGEGLQADADTMDRMLRALLPLDVLVLGMGKDGHTASLFPFLPELAGYLDPAQERLCVAVPPEGGRLPRLSMTARAIDSAGTRLLVLAGEEKRRTLVSAWQEQDPLRMPIKAFLKPPMDIYYSPDGALEN